MILSSSDILQVLAGDSIIRNIAKVRIVEKRPQLTGEEGAVIYIERYPIIGEFEASWKLWVIDYSGEPVDIATQRIKALLPSVVVKETPLGYELTTTDFKYDSTQERPPETPIQQTNTDYEQKFKRLEESIEDRMLLVRSGRPGADGKDGRDGIDGKDGKDLDVTEVELGDLSDVDLEAYFNLERGHVLTWDGSQWTNLFVPQVFNAGQGGQSAVDAGAPSTTIQWKYHIGTGEPPARDFHSDNESDPTAITILHVSDENNAGTDVTSLLNGLLPNTDKIYVYKVDEPSSAHLYNVTGYVETASGYEITVSHIETPGGEPAFVNNSVYGFTFITAGTGGGGGISDAPADNVPYVRYNNTWISWADARDITAQLADIVDGGDADQVISSTSDSTTYDGGDADTQATAATDSTVLDGGLAEPEIDDIIDGGLATV